MATVTEIDEVRVKESLWSVQSRVSWGALVAGAVVGIALYMLLTLLGIALGMTFSERYDAEQLGTAAAYWTFASLLVSMFFGGWVSTRCTAGEFRSEAALYGIIVWALTSALLIPMTALGVGTGVGTVLADRGIAKTKNTIVPAVVNVENKVTQKVDQARRSMESTSSPGNYGSDEGKSSSTSSRDNSSSSSDESAKGSNSRSDDSNSSSASTATDQDSSTPSRDSARSETGQNVRQLGHEAKEKLMVASWWTFGGTFVSLLSCILGALVGPTIVVVRHKYPAHRSTIPVTTTPMVPVAR